MGARHGYDVVVHRLQDDPHRTSAAVRRAKWAKVELLAAALDAADIVLWLDADAMVVDDVEDPSTHLVPGRFQGRPGPFQGPGPFQALAIETFTDRENPNTGVWLMRRDDRSRSFLAEVLRVGQLRHSWADQATVCQLLGWDLGDHHGHGARRVRTTAFSDGTAWLPPEWNVTSAAQGGESVARPVRIRHFAGLPLEERAARMRQLYEDWTRLRHG